MEIGVLGGRCQVVGGDEVPYTPLADQVGIEFGHELDFSTLTPIRPQTADEDRLLRRGK